MISACRHGVRFRFVIGDISSCDNMLPPSGPSRFNFLVTLEQRFVGFLPLARATVCTYLCHLHLQAGY